MTLLEKNLEIGQVFEHLEKSDHLKLARVRARGVCQVTEYSYALRFQLAPRQFASFHRVALPASAHTAQEHTHACADVENSSSRKLVNCFPGGNVVVPTPLRIVLLFVKYAVEFLIATGKRITKSKSTLATLQHL